MEAAIRKTIELEASRFVALRALRMTRLGAELCAGLTLVVPKAQSMVATYALCADLEGRIRTLYPGVEVVIRLLASA